MLSSMRDLARGRIHVPRLSPWTLFTVGVVAVLVALVTLSRPTHVPGGVPEGWNPPSGSLQQAIDLRCLTRRPSDCLEEPVPADEPHGAVCATCHDLWDNRNDPKRVRSCAAAGCHDDPWSLSPFHETLAPEMLGECSHCHVAHAFRASPDGATCTACHAGGGNQVAWAGGRLLKDVPFPKVPFVHEDHVGVTCATCHGVGYAHATLRIRTTDDCRSCHHRARAEAACVECHDQDAVNALEIHVSRELAIDIGTVERPVRWLRFEHGMHTGTPCATCHTEGSALATGPGAGCSTCHLQHHEPTADCAACHARPAADAHDSRAHLGCDGDGCHDAPAGIRDAPRTRSLCLVCHRDRIDHHAGMQCSGCHVLPEPRHSAPLLDG
ncbi:MAG TPA: hypothetical protein VJ997_03855 [Longimicrobiales bacterium]|nr:hypothetical protein [Longimicrobiales bacterium]